MQAAPKTTAAGPMSRLHLPGGAKPQGSPRQGSRSKRKNRPCCPQDCPQSGLLAQLVGRFRTPTNESRLNRRWLKEVAARPAGLSLHKSRQSQKRRNRRATITRSPTTTPSKAAVLHRKSRHLAAGDEQLLK